MPILSLSSFIPSNSSTSTLVKPSLLDVAFISFNLWSYISLDTTCPVLFIKVAICVVLPPGALHTSKTNEFSFGFITFPTSIELTSWTVNNPSL